MHVFECYHKKSCIGQSKHNLERSFLNKRDEGIRWWPYIEHDQCLGRGLKEAAFLKCFLKVLFSKVLFKGAQPIGFKQLTGRQRWEKKPDYMLELLGPRKETQNTRKETQNIGEEIRAIHETQCLRLTASRVVN